jgi:uncharacterized protein YjiS (DUF1127 family)
LAYLANNDARTDITIDARHMDANMRPVYVDPVGSSPSYLTRTFQSGILIRVAGWLEHAVADRRTRLQLGRLGDDGLKDLGLTRDHVEADLGNYYSN